MKGNSTEGTGFTDTSFIKDFLWYFIGSFAPLLIGFIKTPVFTRYFSKEAFGNLGIITITFTFLGMFLFSWIGSCIWRYYAKYKKDDKLRSLYSNLIFLYVLSFIVLAFITVIWYVSAKIELNQALIVYSFFQLVFNQLFLFYMVVIRLMGKVRFYTVIQSVRSLIGLFLALFLVFYMEKDITALVSSLVIVDFISLLCLFLFNPAQVKLSYTDLNKNDLLELMQYGSLGLILNISLLTISYSDRYVIALFYDLESVGIYDQVFKISQLSVMALTTIYFNTINPKLLFILESDYKGSMEFIHKYVYSFVLFGVPIIFYLSLFSEEISTLLLGNDFREGYLFMPFVFMATYLHGISNFFELRLKFSNQLKRLSFVAICTALLNIILNLIFVSLYGYAWAAYTTLISYAFMIMMFYFWDPGVLKGLLKHRKDLFNVLGLLTIQYVLYEFIVDKFRIQFEIRMGIGLIFVSIFFLIFRKTMLKTDIPIN
jgi:O-antigen/teichoic acid export membrane protein